MKVSILGSTKPGFTIPVDDAMLFSGHSAGICYLPDTVESLWNEDHKKTTRRAENNLLSGYHSVFGHVQYNLLIEGCPKIVAMVLNNEKIYNTSEKSARYTKMVCHGKEKDLYDKWLEIYKKRISDVYPEFAEKKVEKLAQENARYLISVFTPATDMEYTVSLQQINYIINWIYDYYNITPKNDFEKKVGNALISFVKSLPIYDIEICPLKDFKGRKLSFFSTRKHSDEFGENYSINYRGTFAQLAQAQRHRTLYYEMSLPNKPSFYTPPIIQNTELEKEWQKDISSLADSYPQGMLVDINERGTLENFLMKCGERLCGAAQLEIAMQTRETLRTYYEEIKKYCDTDTLSKFNSYIDGCTRCNFLSGFHCNNPCVFYGNKFLARKI